jgi:formate hydrogenlyase subunit 6/NADH:ubiquinone oxidoreductase subunit I
MPYEKMTPIKGDYGSCLCCGYQHEILPMDAIIAVGLGVAQVTKNGEVVYDEPYEPKDDSEYWTAQDAENLARQDPDNDWRIHLVGPLSERHYQRQGDSHWVLYEKGEGFA